MSEPFGSLAFDPKTGQVYQLSPEGWQPASEEALVAEPGVIDSAVRSSAQLALGLAGLAGADTGADLQKMRDQQQAAAVGSPVATAVGSVLPDVVLGGSGLGAALGRRAATAQGRMAGRVTADIQRQAGRGGSVGAAAADVPRGALGDRVARFANEMMNAQDMTPDQARMLPVGQRLGFEELPGMRGRGDSPGRMMLGASLSNPSVRFAIQDTLDHNSGLIERYAMRALQAPAEPFGKGGIEFARRGLASSFDRVRNALPEAVDLPAEWVGRFQRVQKGLAGELQDVLEEGSTRISRDNLFALRSDLNLVAGDLSASGSGRRLAGNRIGSLSADLDDFIRDQLRQADPELVGTWQRAREGWLFSELMKKPGVLQPDGSLSLASAAGVMRRELPDAWADVLEGEGRRRLSPEASEFMDALDYANTFRDLVPNSGTATRQAIGKMSAREVLTGHMLRHHLRSERDRLNPVLAP